MRGDARAAEAFHIAMRSRCSYWLRRVGPCLCCMDVSGHRVLDKGSLRTLPGDLLPGAHALLSRSPAHEDVISHWLGITREAVRRRQRELDRMAEGRSTPSAKHAYCCGAVPRLWALCSSIRIAARAEVWVALRTGVHVRASRSIRGHVSWRSLLAEFGGGCVCGWSWGVSALAPALECPSRCAHP